MCAPRTKHLAEFSQAERSEAPPREARSAAAEGGGSAERSEAFGPSEARRDPEPREGIKRKLGATKLAATQLPRPNADSSFSGFVGTALAGSHKKYFQNGCV